MSNIIFEELEKYKKSRQKMFRIICIVFSICILLIAICVGSVGHSDFRLLGVLLACMAMPLILAIAILYFVCVNTPKKIARKATEKLKSLPAEELQALEDDMKLVQASPRCKEVVQFGKKLAFPIIGKTTVMFSPKRLENRKNISNFVYYRKPQMGFSHDILEYRINGKKRSVVYIVGEYQKHFNTYCDYLISLLKKDKS